MNPFRTPWQAWNRFWFAPVSARPLGAFRVVYGILAIANLLLLTVDLDYWLSDVGLLRGTEASELAGPLRFSPLLILHDPLTVRLILGLTLATAVGLTLGWQTRLMSILYYLGLLSIHHRNLLTTSGADVLFVAVAFYLMLSPCGRAYSLDALIAARRRGGGPADPLIVPWAQRLIQIQVGVVYLSTSLLKVAGPTWLNGTALHYILCNREIGRFDVGWVASYPILVNVLTFGGLGIELCLAFLLWFRSARPWVIPLGISLHLGIMVLVNIPLFGELTCACYLTFLTSGEWASLTARLNPISWAARKLRRPSLPRRGLLPRPRSLGATSEVIKASRGSA